MVLFYSLFGEANCDNVRWSDDERITKQRQYSCALGCWSQQKACCLFCFSKGIAAVNSLTEFSKSHGFIRKHFKRFTMS